MFIFSQFGAATEKICKDIRFLQSQDEIMEPFEKEQIGSSAMPYKRNPMKSERVCSLARKLIGEVIGGLSTVADQGLERTLDDSAFRRITIPDAFLYMDAILTILQVGAFNKFLTFIFRIFLKVCMFTAMSLEKSTMNCHFWHSKKL